MGQSAYTRDPVPQSNGRPGQTRREAGTQSQGSSVTEDRPAAEERTQPKTQKESEVKSILARFTAALALLASMALTVGAGLRWN